MNATEFIILVFSIIGSLLILTATYGKGIYNDYKDFRIKLNKIKRNINLRIKIWRAMR